jgi:signal transduction histidine kinase
MLVPMRIRAHEIGILTVYGYNYNATFTQDDLTFVLSLASQATIALSNIMKTEQRIRTEQLLTVGKVTNYLTEKFTPELMSIHDTAESFGREDPDLQTRQTFSLNVRERIERILTISEELQGVSLGKNDDLLEQHSWSIKEFIEDLVTRIKPNFTHQHIHIHQNLEYFGDFTVDKKKMQHVFLNIADHARYVMPNGGNFTIASRLSENMVHLEFIEDSYGLSPEMQAHFFEPFLSDEENHSIGLGMSIVKKIIDEHDAQIEVRSGVGKGTTIHISLPQPQ